MQFKIYCYRTEQWGLALPIIFVLLLATITLAALLRTDPSAVAATIGAGVGCVLLILSFLTAKKYWQEVRKPRAFDDLRKGNWASKLTLHERLLLCQQIKIFITPEQDTGVFKIQSQPLNQYQNQLDPAYPVPQQLTAPHKERLNQQLKKLITFFGFAFIQKQLNFTKNADWAFFLLSHFYYQDYFPIVLKKIYHTFPSSTEERELVAAMIDRFQTQANAPIKQKPYPFPFSTIDTIYFRNVHINLLDVNTIPKLTYAEWSASLDALRQAQKQLAEQSKDCSKQYEQLRVFHKGYNEYLHHLKFNTNTRNVVLDQCVELLESFASKYSELSQQIEIVANQIETAQRAVENAKKQLAEAKNQTVPQFPESKILYSQHPFGVGFRGDNQDNEDKNGVSGLNAPLSSQSPAVVSSRSRSENPRVLLHPRDQMPLSNLANDSEDNYAVGSLIEPSSSVSSRSRSESPKVLPKARYQVPLSNPANDNEEDDIANELGTSPSSRPFTFPNFSGSLRASLGHQVPPLNLSDAKTSPLSTKKPNFFTSHPPPMLPAASTASIPSTQVQTPIVEMGVIREIV